MDTATLGGKRFAAIGTRKLSITFVTNWAYVGTTHTRTEGVGCTPTPEVPIREQTRRALAGTQGGGIPLLLVGHSAKKKGKEGCKGREIA